MGAPQTIALSTGSVVAGEGPRRFVGETRRKRQRSPSENLQPRDSQRDTKPLLKRHSRSSRNNKENTSGSSSLSADFLSSTLQGSMKSSSLVPSTKKPPRKKKNVASSHSAAPRNNNALMVTVSIAHEEGGGEGVVTQAGNQGSSDVATSSFASPAPPKVEASPSVIVETGDRQLRLALRRESHRIVDFVSDHPAASNVPPPPPAQGTDGPSSGEEREDCCAVQQQSEQQELSEGGPVVTLTRESIISAKSESSSKNVGRSTSRNAAVQSPCSSTSDAPLPHIDGGPAPRYSCSTAASPRPDRPKPPVSSCAYASELFKVMIQQARTMKTKVDYFQDFEGCPSSDRVSPRSRREVVAYIVDVSQCIRNPISVYSIHTAVNIFDRYLSHLATNAPADLKEKAAAELEVVGAACIHLASKLQDSWALCLGDVCQTFDGGSLNRKDAVLRWEEQILRDFRFLFYTPTILDFLCPMMDRLWETQSHEATKGVAEDGERSKATGGGGGSYTPVVMSQAVEDRAHEIAESALLCERCLGFGTHVVAASTLLIAITQVLGKPRRVSNLPACVRELLGRDQAELCPCTEQLHKWLESRRTLKEMAVARDLTEVKGGSNVKIEGGKTSSPVLFNGRAATSSIDVKSSDVLASSMPMASVSASHNNNDEACKQQHSQVVANAQKELALPKESEENNKKGSNGMLAGVGNKCKGASSSSSLVKEEGERKQQTRDGSSLADAWQPLPAAAVRSRSPSVAGSQRRNRATCLPAIVALTQHRRRLMETSRQMLMLSQTRGGADILVQQQQSVSRRGQVFTPSVAAPPPSKEKEAQLSDTLPSGGLLLRGRKNARRRLTLPPRADIKDSALPPLYPSRSIAATRRSSLPPANRGVEAVGRSIDLANLLAGRGIEGSGAADPTDNQHPTGRLMAPLSIPAWRLFRHAKGADMKGPDYSAGEAARGAAGAFGSSCSNISRSCGRRLRAASLTAKSSSFMHQASTLHSTTSRRNSSDFKHEGGESDGVDLLNGAWRLAKGGGPAACVVGDDVIDPPAAKALSSASDRNSCCSTQCGSQESFCSDDGLNNIGVQQYSRSVLLI